MVVELAPAGAVVGDKVPSGLVLRGTPEALAAPGATVTLLVALSEGWPGVMEVAGLMAADELAPGEVVAGNPAGPGGAMVDWPGGDAVVGAPCTCAHAGELMPRPATASTLISSIIRPVQLRSVMEILSLITRDNFAPIAGWCNRWMAWLYPRIGMRGRRLFGTRDRPFTPFRAARAGAGSAWAGNARQRGAGGAVGFGGVRTGMS